MESWLRSSRGRACRGVSYPDVQLPSSIRQSASLRKGWSEASRYARKKKADAQVRYDAITDRKHGVFSWLKLRW